MAQTRVVVMNGQRLTQEATASSKWEVVKVDKAGALKAGVYNLDEAKPSEVGKSYTGPVVHVDRSEFYQQSQTGLIKHVMKGVSVIPEPGSVKSVLYSAQNVGPTIKDIVQLTATKKQTRSH